MENIISLMKVYSIIIRKIFFSLSNFQMQKKKKNIHDLIRRNITINQENIKY